jgi:hypothetical protein
VTLARGPRRCARRPDGTNGVAPKASRVQRGLRRLHHEPGSRVGQDEGRLSGAPRESAGGPESDQHGPVVQVQRTVLAVVDPCPVARWDMAFDVLDLVRGGDAVEADDRGVALEHFLVAGRALGAAVPVRSGLGPILEPSVHGGLTDSLFGFPIIVNQDMPASTANNRAILFGTSPPATSSATWVTCRRCVSTSATPRACKWPSSSGCAATASRRTPPPTRRSHGCLIDRHSGRRA